jgi:PAS domain S-box-containing protein
MDNLGSKPSSAVRIRGRGMNSDVEKTGARPQFRASISRIQPRKHLGLSFSPIPTLIILIIVLRYTISSSRVFEPHWLLPVTNTIFIGLVCFAVAIVAARNYKANGRIQVFLLGCGVLVFGIGGIVAAFLRNLPGRGANLNVTIYNTSALLGALFHFVASLLLLFGVSPEAGSKGKRWWLVLGYAGSIIFVGLVTAAGLAGMIPPFFVQRVGPTGLRQGILGAADILFAFAFLVFIGNYLRNREIFLYWYSCALALTSISLTAFFIESSIGSAVGWAGRSAQYLGGVYFLIALLTAARSAAARETSLDSVLTASLSPAEEKFRALAENAPDMIRRFDRNMEHIYVNPASLRFYGKPAGSIIGKSVEEVGLTEAQCRIWRNRIENVFKTGRQITVEEYLDAGDGTRFCQSICVPEYAADGTVANILVLSRDLTERKRAEEALAQERSNLQTIFDVVNVGMILIDETGAVRRVNETISRWVRKDLSAHLGSPPGDFVGCVHALSGANSCGRTSHCASCPIRRTFESVLSSGKPVHNVEALATLSIEGRSSQMWLEISADPLTLNEKNYVILAMNDITRRKEAEESLRRTSEELQRSNLDLEQFASVASHDLQEPLRLVRGFLTLLEQRHAPQLAEDAKKYIHYSVESAQRMSQLIADLLSYSRVGHKSGQFKPVETREALSSALENLRSSIEEAAAVVTHDALPAVNGDPVQLLQLFQNLIGNAIKFRNPARQCQIHIGARQEENMWRFSVHDNGIGIPKEAFDRVFLLFRRLHNRGEYAGTGIGLAICKKIVERHSGRIWVESVLGEGSTFCFLLPAAKEAARSVPL